MIRSPFSHRRWVPRASVALMLVVAAAAASVGVDAGPATAAAHEVVVGPGDSVQAALTAAAPGTTIKLKAGTYHQYLAMPDGVTLEGSGTDAVGGTVLAWPTSGANPCGYTVLVCLRNHDRVTDLRVDITAAPPSGIPGVPNVGIGTATSPTGTTVDDVVAVGNSPDGGIVLVGSNATIRDTETSGLGTGLLVSAVGGNIEDNFGHGNCTDILVIDFGLLGIGPLGQASNVTVEDNRVEGPEICPPYNGGGINVLHAPYTTVRDNTVSGLHDVAIFADSQHVAIVDNNLVNNCAGVGIEDQGIPDGAGNAVVRGNEVRGTGDPACYPNPFPFGLLVSGIGISGATNTTVTDNDVRVALPSPSSGAAVYGLVVSSTFTRATPANVTVAGNEVRETLNRFAGSDILWDLTGSGITFKRNECKTSSPAGLCSD